MRLNSQKSGIMRIGLYIVLSVVGSTIWACRTNSVDPQLSAETQKVNSSQPAEQLTWTDYKAVYIKWGSPYGLTTEGNTWQSTPQPGTLASDYTLSVESLLDKSGAPTDSLALYVTGKGNGPSLTRASLGHFLLSRSFAAGGVTGQVTFTNWYLYDRYSKANDQRILVTRNAYTDHTDYSVIFDLCQVVNNKASDYGTYQIYDVSRSPDVAIIGSFIFRRSTSAVVK